MDGESQCVKFSWELKYEAYGSRKSCSSTDSRRRATYSADVHVRVFFVHLGGVGKKKKTKAALWHNSFLENARRKSGFVKLN